MAGDKAVGSWNASKIAEICWLENSSVSKCKAFHCVQKSFHWRIFTGETFIGERDRFSCYTDAAYRVNKLPGVRAGERKKTASTFDRLTMQMKIERTHRHARNLELKFREREPNFNWLKSADCPYSIQLPHYPARYHTAGMASWSQNYTRTSDHQRGSDGNFVMLILAIPMNLIE